MIKIENSGRRHCLKSLGFWGIMLIASLTYSHEVSAQEKNVISKVALSFESEGVELAGTLLKPEKAKAAIVLVHGSGQESRMMEFAASFAKKGIMVFTYDKRGVGSSGGVYAGPEVGTNNISTENLNLLAKDVSAAVAKLSQHSTDLPIGLVGYSQAGWVIPLAASTNSLVQFMVLFSCPTITTLEQLRFQFYTDGRKDFWENHTEAEARYHLKHDPDRYQFAPTDPKVALDKLSISGLWLFGEKDIQIPVKVCIEDLNSLKEKGKPFEYSLFPSLGHHTALDQPTAIATQWIQQKAAMLGKVQ